MHEKTYHTYITGVANSTKRAQKAKELRDRSMEPEIHKNVKHTAHLLPEMLETNNLGHFLPYRSAH
jgi:hypothetical protein